MSNQWRNRCSFDNRPGRPEEARFSLRDYLSPGGMFPYSELDGDLEAARLDGFPVVLISVPGFLVCHADPKIKTKRPWYSSARSKAYRTAGEARRA